MSKAKWGESFLKSGLPLEHLTAVTLKAQGLSCSTSIEYSRTEESGQETWFELDLEAHFLDRNKDTSLSLLVECKYHDESRFWFFLPFEPKRWYFNDRVFNCGPLQTFTDPLSSSSLALAPLSHRGMVVSKDGKKQENAVHIAIKQIANAFVPVTLDTMFLYRLAAPRGYVPLPTCMVPMIVTNADIFRLRPDISDLAVIRKASSPSDIGQKLSWTWCYYDPPMELSMRNERSINAYKNQNKDLIARFPLVNTRLELWASRPNWIAVANVNCLEALIKAIRSHFLSLKTCRARTALNKNRKVRLY